MEKEKDRVGELARAAGLTKLNDKQLAQFAAGVASARALAEALPKDLHWSEESALVYRPALPARPAR
jgi:hypothetical protein